ncbi:hypothetical protein ACO0KY_11675 [Undibacterium sp. Dicai25W]|uniref:hypothetical protein n=1 Tax=Undibacterium sp. Dicai25W TaxID=3413034 RepID=UPI003BF01771
MYFFATCWILPGNVAISGEIFEQVLNSKDIVVAPHDPLLKCAYEDKKFQNARNLIEKTEEFKNMQSRIQEPFRVAYLEKAVDSPIEYHGVCFDSVTVYVDRKEKFELVLSFVVNRNTHQIYLQDLNGTFRHIIKK